MSKRTLVFCVCDTFRTLIYQKLGVVLADFFIGFCYLSKITLFLRRFFNRPVLYTIIWSLEYRLVLYPIHKFKSEISLRREQYLIYNKSKLQWLFLYRSEIRKIDIFDLHFVKRHPTVKLHGQTDSLTDWLTHWLTHIKKCLDITRHRSPMKHVLNLKRLISIFQEKLTFLKKFQDGGIRIWWSSFSYVLGLYVNWGLVEIPITFGFKDVLYLLSFIHKVDAEFVVIISVIGCFSC